MHIQKIYRITCKSYTCNRLDACKYIKAVKNTAEYDVIKLNLKNLANKKLSFHSVSKHGLKHVPISNIKINFNKVKKKIKIKFL